MAKHHWTGRDEAELRSRYAHLPARRIATALGRSVASVRNKIDSMGLRKQRRVRWTPELLDRVLALHAAGWCDSEIADELRCHSTTLGALRRRRGLPHNRFSQRQRDHTRRMTAAQCEADGVGNLAEIQQLHRRAQAARRGWPPDCTPRMCDVLDALETGPKTRREMCSKLGVRWHRCKALTTTGGRGILSVLEELGLVVRIGRKPFRAGRGQTEWVYQLRAGFARRARGGRAVAA